MRDSRFYMWFGLAAVSILAFLAILFWALFSIVRTVDRGVDTIRDTTENTIGPVGDLTSGVATQVADFMNPTPTVLPSPESIIRDVRSLARLETIQYSIEKVVTAENRQGPLGFLFGDRLLLVAHGEVIAGIDLSKLSAEDLRLEDGTLYVQLPPPEIFIATLNNDKSYIYDRDIGILTQGSLNLESEARRAAEDAIGESAIEDGILTQARQNAEIYLERLFETLGYPDVVFEEAEQSSPTTPVLTPSPTP